MTPLQKARFLAAIHNIFPDLANDNNPQLKLRDLNSIGLQGLYSMCIQTHHGMDGQITKIFHERAYPAAYALDIGKCKDICEESRKKTRTGFMKNPSYYYQEFLDHLEHNKPYDFNGLGAFHFHPGGYDKPYLKDRNLLWITTMLEYNQQHGVDFFAFGNGHLPGNYGILNLLLNRGFRIRKANDLCQFGAYKEHPAYTKKRQLKFLKEENIRAESIVKQAKKTAEKMITDEAQRAANQIGVIQQKFNSDKTKAFALVKGSDEKFSNLIKTEQQKFKNLTMAVNKNLANQFKAIQTKIAKSNKSKPALMLAKNQLTAKKQEKAKKLQAIKQNFQKTKAALVNKRTDALKLAKKKRDLIIEQAIKTYKTQMDQAKKYSQNQKSKVKAQAISVINSAKKQADSIRKQAEKRVKKVTVLH